MEFDVLKKVGLSGGEIKVYLSLLKSGQCKTGELTKSTEVSRSKIYEILERLIKKGLVNYVIKENIKYFSAASPKNLEVYMEQKIKDILREEEEIKGLVHELIKLKKSKEEMQAVEIYEGYKGIKISFNDILNELKRGEEYYAFAVSKESYTREFLMFIQNYHKKREDKGINIKLLAHISLQNKIKKDIGDYKNIELKFTSEKTPVSTIIFNSKVLIFTWRNPTAIVIKSKEISNHYKKFFVELWKIARK